MDYSKRVKDDYQQLLRKKAGLERRIESELNRGVERYRADFAALRQGGQRRVSVIAEGDSWFRYGVGFAVIYHLEKLLGIDILNLAKPGDEARKMLTGRQIRRLKRELRRGPSHKLKYDFLLFSGGGNDLVGEDTFYKWLHDYETGMDAADVINNRTLNAALQVLKIDYQRLLKVRDDASKNTHIILHAYDLAYPDGRGVCWLGPWLQPGLKQRKVPEKLRKEVVELFLKKFEQLLKRLARQSSNVHVVPTQGTLVRHAQWANELHPKEAGFKKMAAKFKIVIENA